MIGKLLGMFIWLVVVPIGMGLLHNAIGERKALGWCEKLMSGFCYGYILMWAVFQLIAVFFVLRRGKLYQVAFCFEMIALSLAVMGWLFFFLQAKQTKLLRAKTEQIGALEVALWGMFAVTVLFQLYMSYKMAYADGDDSFYLSISTAANLGGSMYQLDPYTGAPTTLDVRHGLAPFPIWISFVTLKAGVHTAVAAHSFIPLALIPLTYAVYWKIGRCLVEKKYLPLFMIFISALQIFGNYSIYPASTFLLTRTRQGKAALGNVILPFLLYLLLKLAKKEGKAGKTDIFWLFTTVLAGCLCSTMAGFLSSMLIMLGAVLLGVFYKRPKLMAQCLLSCVPGILFAGLYALLK